MSAPAPVFPHPLEQCELPSNPFAASIIGTDFDARSSGFVIAGVPDIMSLVTKRMIRQSCHTRCGRVRASGKGSVSNEKVMVFYRLCEQVGVSTRNRNWAFMRLLHSGLTGPPDDSDRSTREISKMLQHWGTQAALSNLKRSVLSRVRSILTHGAHPGQPDEAGCQILDQLPGNTINSRKGGRWTLPVIRSRPMLQGRLGPLVSYCILWLVSPLLWERGMSDRNTLDSISQG